MMTMTITLDPPDAIQKFSQFSQRFRDGLEQTHRMWVFRVLEYLVRFSRVDTGRSRAAWMPFMDDQGYSYQRSLTAPPNVEDLTGEGRLQGTYDHQGMETTVYNNVKYVDSMNQKYGLIAFAPGMASTASGRVKKMQAVKLAQGVQLETMQNRFEQWGQENFQKFVDQAKLAFERSRKFNPGLIEPFDNPPPTASF